MTQVTFEQAMQIAIGHYEAGRLQPAEQICRQVLERDPNRADAFHLLGLIAHRVNHPDAANLIRRALSLDPTNASAYSNLGLVLQAQGKSREALECCRQALALAPSSPEMHYNLGFAFQCAGNFENAAACYRRTLELQPDHAAAPLNLGAALQAAGHTDEAIATYRRLLAKRPDYAEAHSNLGNLLWEQGHADQAVASCRRALALQPNYPEAQMNLGNALVSQNQFDEAIASFRRSIALRPDYADAHSNLGLALLTVGQYEEGWRENEWRWRKAAFPSVRRNFAQPAWDGAELNGRTILLHAEQALGDTLQFVRFVPEVRRRGGRVVLEVQPSMVRLMQNSIGLGTEEVLPQDPSGATPPVAFDLHLPLMSLPLALNMLDPEKSPSPVPYLQADETALRLPELQTPLKKVGLVWAGRPWPRDRSIPLRKLAPLARENVKLFSLQIGEPAQRLRQSPPDFELIDLSPHIDDFADTAALVAQLDLVICIDSAVAHLAGAMGKPAWVMLKYSPDFRWLLEREDSPWYPTLRLFRQQRDGDWDEVIERVARKLDEVRNRDIAPPAN
jgi:tetratricopeptide (TPR) repeat protein